MESILNKSWISYSSLEAVLQLIDCGIFGCVTHRYIAWLHAEEYDRYCYANNVRFPRALR